MSKVSSIFSGLALIAFVSLGFSQGAHAATFNYTGSPVADSTTSFSGQGSCQTSGNVTFSLRNNGGTTTPISSGSVNTQYNAGTGSYDFNSSYLSVPNNYPTGPTTLVATCPNGITYTVPIVVLASNQNLLNLGTNQGTINGPVSVSGFCNGTNNNGPVTFTLDNGSSVTAVNTAVPGIPVNASGTNGSFTTTLNLPTQYNQTLATLKANCPNGSTSSILTVLGDPNGTTNGMTTPTNTTIGTDVGGTNENGSVLGATTGTIPQGGVAAGSGSTATSSITSNLIIALSIAAVLGGIYAASRKRV